MIITQDVPDLGLTVRVMEDVLTREPGDRSCTEFVVKAGEVGIVKSIVEEWNDYEVALFTRDGQTAWLEPNNLEVVECSTSRST